MKLYDELVWRNMIKDVSNAELVKKQLDGKIKFYCGFDPTGDSLTIGHLVQIVRMKLLANHGHIPYVLVGGATGLIGDPRETSERVLLTLEQSLKNSKLIKKQIYGFLGDEAIYVDNYDWLKDLSIFDYLRDYGKHFPINYMLAKDIVDKRLETGISYTEFSYMILQSIDFYHLYKHDDVKLQFGGSDQWGNITAGLELIRKLEGHNDATGLSGPLLLKADGAKFGKSESGALWLDKEKTSPYELYQFFLNTADEDVENYLKALTLLSKKQIEDIIEESKKDLSKRYAQKRLAEEVVCFVHSKEDLDGAIEVTEALFSGEFANLSENSFKSLATILGVLDIDDKTNIAEVLVKTKLASSNREAREFITNGAILLNGVKVTSTDFVISNEAPYKKIYFIVKRGKKKYSLLRSKA